VARINLLEEVIDLILQSLPEVLGKFLTRVGGHLLEGRLDRTRDLLGPEPDGADGRLVVEYDGKQDQGVYEGNLVRKTIEGCPGSK